MNGTYLRFYMHENRKHRHLLLYEWLLEKAKKMGIHGGSAFRAIAGYGRHGVLHEQHFYELAGDLTVEVEFMISEDEARELLDLVKAEKIHIFYAKTAAEFGAFNGDGEPGSRAD
jgi:PII-like signaling protein